MKILAINKNLFAQTKKGAASIYVVVFATILFGVITLSFVSVILSEAGQSSDDDLSRSAYDAALAGVEDAKQAYEKYIKNGCRQEVGGSRDECEKLEHETKPGIVDTGDDCLKMMKFLGKIEEGDVEGEVLITEQSNGEGESTDQAYTCVTMSNQTEDFRATLDETRPTMIVPIGQLSSTLGNVKKIEFNWFSPGNQGNKSVYTVSGDKFEKMDKERIPSTITLTLVAAGSMIEIPAFEDSDYWGQSTMVLLPNSTNNEGESVTTIAKAQIKAAAEATAEDSSNKQNKPFSVSVNTNATDYMCKVVLEVDDLFSEKGASNALLIVSNTYNDGQRNDFSVVAKDSDGNTVPFEGAQIKVDSTGRANQLVRRVEARIDPADLGFPVPEYALQLGGEGDDSLSKEFYITNNCWTEEGKCPNNNNKKGNPSF